MRYIDHLARAIEGVTPGIYSIAHSEPGTDPVEFLADCNRRTVAHGDAIDRVWMVRAGESDDSEVIVAMTGNGPTSEVNAGAIAYLLAAGPYLVATFFAALVVCEQWPLDSEQGRALSVLRDAMAPLLGDDGSTDPTPPEG